MTQRMRRVAPAGRRDDFFCFSVSMTAEVKMLILIIFGRYFQVASLSLRTYQAVVKLFLQFNMPFDIQRRQSNLFANAQQINSDFHFERQLLPQAYTCFAVETD